MRKYLVYTCILTLGLLSKSVWACGGGGDNPGQNPAMAVENAPLGQMKPPIELPQASGTNRGWLGLRVEDAASEDKPGDMPGAKVTFVTPDSPAAKAGIREGDIITGYQDKPITGAKQFRDVLYQSSPNTTVSLTLDRRGKKIDTQVTLAALSTTPTPGSMVPQNIPRDMHPGMYQQQMMSQTPLKNFVPNAGGAPDTGNQIKTDPSADIIYPILSRKADLNLDADQVKKLEGLQLELKKQIIHLEAQIQVGELEMEEQHSEPELKMGQIKVKLGQLESARSQKWLATAQTLKKAQDLLSAEQRQKLAGLR